MRTVDLLMDTQMLLDEASCLIRESKVPDAFRVLHQPLAEFRDAALRQGVYTRFQDAVRDHDIMELAQEDPLTRRAFNKPRGYPGDPGTVDLIFRGTPPEGTSDTGRRIFRTTSRSSSALSLVFRRNVLRAYIDDTVVHAPEARILSVAAGHCRELEESLILAEDSNARFYAIDQDPWVCKNVARDYAHRAVKVRNRRISSLLEDDSALGQFELIYAQSLFDHVGPGVATRLVAALIERLAPGGRLIVANFRPDSECRGYMDTLMDWHMAYRSTDELASLFEGHESGLLRTFVDPHGNVTYAEYRDGS